VTQAHLLLAAVLQYLESLDVSEQQMVAPLPELSGFRGNRDISSHLRYQVADDLFADVYLRQAAPDVYRITLDESDYEVQWLSDGDEGIARIAIDGIQQTIHYAFLGRGEVAVQLAGQACVLVNQLAFTKGDEGAAGSGTVTAPMHGNVMELMVAVGDIVNVGDTLAVMEAMKMEHRLKAQVAGTVAAVYAEAGEQIAAGSVLLEITEPE